MRQLNLLRGLFVAATIGLTLASQAGPTARSSDEGLVKIEFRALDREDRPILDLRAGEIALKVDGRETRIERIDLVRFGEVTPPPSEPRPDPLPSPYSSNHPSEMGRDVLVLLDDEAFRPGREKSVVDALNILVSGLSSDDRIGLRTVPLGGEVVPLTKDRAEIRRAISKISGRASVNPSPLDVACKTRQILQLLPPLFSNVRRDMPLTIVFLTSGVLTPNWYPTDLCEVRTTDYNALELPAIASRAFFHSVQVLEDATFGWVPLNTLTAGLQHLNQSAGGYDIVRLSGGAPEAILDVLEQSSAYYSLSFAPQSSWQNGRDHRMELRVKRDGTKVIAPSKVIIPASAEMARRDKQGDLERLVFERPHQELPLRATAFAARDVQEALKVVAVFQPVEPAAKLQSAMITLIDDFGNVRAQWTARPADLERSPVSTALEANRGQYRMRLVAIDTAGRRGTVDRHIRVDSQRAGPVRLSDVMLASSDGGPLVPRLLFGPERVGVAYIEVYDAPETAELSVRFEVARSATGPALGTVAGTVEKGDAGASTAFGAFSVEALPPGDYQVRAIVTVDGKETGQASQTLRKISG